MKIEKNGKIYTVEQYSQKWVVTLRSGKLSVAYDVSKKLCPTEAELREYVLKNNELF